VFDAHSKQIPGYIGVVKYETEPAEIPLDALHRNGEEIDQEKKQQLIAPMYRKADAWEYEDEHRIIVERKDVKTRYLNGYEFESIPLPIQAVRIVDFGINYSPTERHQLIATLREGSGAHIQFRQCVRKNIRYEVNICTLCLPPRSKLSTSSTAEAAARHRSKQTLRASGLDESQEAARSKLRGMNPVAIQLQAHHLNQTFRPQATFLAKPT
jgi:hypothetical protein